MDTNQQDMEMHLKALEIASMLPNSNLQELLTNADKIEDWMWEPQDRNEEERESLLKRLANC